MSMRREEKKAMIQVALAYVGENLYRAMASWTDADADRALTDRFISSLAFLVQERGDSGMLGQIQRGAFRALGCHR
jgi:hypothetical protein